MTACDFWRSVRGTQFVDRTLPQLVLELRRLNDHLDRLQASQLRDAAATSRKEDKP